MFNFVDKILNGVTMYRLLLYFLLSLLAAALVLSAAGILPYSPAALLFTSLVLSFACFGLNQIFARLVKVTTNIESAALTALILTFIITPVRMGDWNGLFFLAAASFFAMGSKYLLTYKKKHIFNPAAFGAVATFYLIQQGASWWVGVAPMIPFIIIGGFLVIRKIQRFQMVGLFLALAAVITSFVAGPDVIRNYILASPVLFFAIVMFTEPLTSPTRHHWRLAYAALIAVLFAWPIYYNNFYMTPELALLAGNIFSFAVSSKGRYFFKLKQRKEVANETIDFIFETDKKLNFEPGQYLEWTLGLKKPDTRGNRRYFTIASSPTENEVILGTKFYPDPSAFKKGLRELEPGTEMNASQLSGDFVMPQDTSKKLAFLAGGIGITPFRSMIKYLLDTSEKRDIVLIYSNKTGADIAYKDILNQAQGRLGIKTVYAVTDKTGFVTADIIKTEMPDFAERIFYISGSHNMVTAFEKMLKELGIPNSQIKTDFFPGLV